MVTPSTTINKPPGFGQSGSSVNKGQKQKKTGPWTKGSSKIQKIADPIVKPEDTKIVIPPTSSNVVATKGEPKKQENKKTTEVSAPVLVQSDDSPSEVQSTPSSQLLAKVADNKEAAQILKLSDNQILKSPVATMGSKEKDASAVVIAPSIDPKLFEEQQNKIVSLMSELQKQSAAVSSLKIVLEGSEKENKQLQKQANQAKLLVLSASESAKKLNPDGDTNIGDTVSVEYIQQAKENLATDMEKLKQVFELSLSSQSQLKAKPSEVVAESASIPCSDEVNKLFSEACILQKEVELEAKKMETKDSRSMASILNLFRSFIIKAQDIVDKELKTKIKLDKDLKFIQQEIEKKTTTTFSKPQREGVEIISGFYTEKQFFKDIERHSILLNQMKSELKDVVTHYVSTIEMLNNITHNIAVALVDCDDSEIDDTIMEVSSTLNKLPIDIKSITCPEVKESVISSAFSNIYLAINTYQTMLRKKRLAIMGLTVPSDETLKVKHIEYLKNLAKIQKLHLIELDKIWKMVSSHVLRRKTELEEEVNKGNQNIKLSESALTTVTNVMEITLDDFKQNKILAYDIAHRERSTTLHELIKDLQNLFKVAGLAKQEANRTFDAFTRGGTWIYESWWLANGYHDQEVTDLFTND